MNACEENRSERIRKLKEISQFAGATFQQAVQEGDRVTAKQSLQESRKIEWKIKVLERM